MPELSNKQHSIFTMKRIYVVILFYIVVMNVSGQQPLYCYSWEPGLAIQQLGVQQGPISQTIRACGGNSVSFSARVVDLNYGTCVKGSKHMQFPDADYTFTYSSSSNFATFSANGQTTLSGVAFHRIEQTIPVPGQEDTKIFILVSVPVKVDISNMWDGSPITITVTISEIQTNLPDCHSGNQVDPDYIYAWQIVESTSGPMEISRVDDVPSENTWELYEYADGSEFEYLATPNPPPAYEGEIINETFGMITAGGIFTMLDLTSDWKMAHPDVMFANDAAVMIFMPGQPYSFDIQSNNTFKDIHGGFALDFSHVQDIFTPAAIANKRVGYHMPQMYAHCVSGHLKTNHVYLKIDFSQSPNAIEFKKIH